MDRKDPDRIRFGLAHSDLAMSRVGAGWRGASAGSCRNIPIFPSVKHFGKFAKFLLVFPMPLMNIAKIQLAKLLKSTNN